jgi:DNA-binding XRE family transcriptional regulator
LEHSFIEQLLSKERPLKFTHKSNCNSAVSIHHKECRCSAEVYPAKELLANEFPEIMPGMTKAQHAFRYRELPSLLRKLREDAGLTQRDLAKKMRVSHVFIHTSETGGRRVDITEFMDWCLACSVQPVDAVKKLQQLRGL